MAEPDYHPEDLKAALRKRFGSLRAFEKQSRLPALAVKAAIRRPHARAEKAIAKALNLQPQLIWPSRYDNSGKRLSPQPAANYGRDQGQQVAA